MMDDKRKLTGHPWHVGYLKKDEDDPRRHKSRCVYFSRDDSRKGHCARRSGTCIGSAHCQDYKETVAEKEVSSVKINELLLKIFKGKR